MLRSVWTRALSGATVASLVLGACSVGEAPPDAPRAAAAAEPARTSASPSPPSSPVERSQAPSPAEGEGDRAAPKPVVAVTEESQDVRTPRETSQRSEVRSSNPLAKHFPKQFRARQVQGRPATAHWALIIGIDDYAGGTTDTVGSVNDAKALRAYLRSEGWRGDHIMLLRDRLATAANIVHAIRWLRDKADRDSVVVFHYSGHEKPATTRADGDDEARDVALWASDNRLVIDGDLGRELGKVRADRMWINIAACRAGGFDDAGMSGANRIITYSSPERELSYEDPDVRHSVFGYHVLALGFREGFADRNDDGTITVEEAFAYGDPRVTDHTSGRQHPQINDGYPGAFVLRVPDPPEPGPGPSGSPKPCTLDVVCEP